MAQVRMNFALVEVYLHPDILDDYLPSNTAQGVTVPGSQTRLGAGRPFLKRAR